MKLLIFSIGVLFTSIIFASKDPIAWSLTQALPAKASIANPSTTSYKLTNNTKFLEKITLVTNTPEFTITANDCASLAAGANCNFTATYVPTVVENVGLQVIMHYGITYVPLPKQTISATRTSTLSLTATPTTLNFTVPGTQSITFKTTPATPGLDINVNNLPSGVTGAYYCKTDNNGACSIALTATQSAYGNAILNVVAQGVDTPPKPIITIAKTTIKVADTTIISPGEMSTVLLTNNGAFDWQSTTTDALQIVGNNVAEFAGDIGACATHTITSGTSCMVSFLPTVNAKVGDSVHLITGSNSEQKGNGGIYIAGGLTASLSSTNNPFTDINQQTVLTLINTSLQSTIPITNVGFTHNASNIHNVVISNDKCSGKVLVAGANCTITYSSQVMSYGSDTITAQYTIDGNSQTVKSSLLRVKAPTITLQLGDPPSGPAIANGSFINLATNTGTQFYTIKVSPFAWQNASVILQHPPTNDTTPSSFFKTNCSGTVMPSTASACTVTFNTLINDEPSIAALNFDPNTILLEANGSNLDATLTWPVAPVVGEFMQGGVVFWVGSDNTKPGYHQALVAAVDSSGASPSWDNSPNPLATAAVLTGFFQGSGGQASGLSNTNKILAQLGSSTNLAAGAAHAYHGGGYLDWFLPAGGNYIQHMYPTVCTLSTMTTPPPIIPNSGEACEMTLLSSIINVTAGHHGGEAMGTEDYWTSTEYDDDPTQVWVISRANFQSAQATIAKSSWMDVRSIRTFTYWNN